MLHIVCIALLLIFVLFPILWVLSTSLKDAAETFATPPTFIPLMPTLVNYLSLWKQYNFGLYYLNSFLTSMGATMLCLTVANLAGFGFSRYRMRFGSSLRMMILITQMVPGVLYIIPYFFMMSRAGLINTRIALIIAHTSFSLPFCTWMLQGYYESIPKSIDEAGKIDGCGHVQVLARIVLPLTLPGNLAVLIFAFMQSWNEYLFSMSLTTSEQMFTLPVRITMFLSEYKILWNELMAAAATASIPVILIYLLVDKYLVGGLTAGAVRQ